MRHPMSYGYTGLLPLHRGLMVCALLGMAGCAPAVSGPVAARTMAASGGAREAEAAILEKINTAIGSASCKTDDQCRTLGLGANACGGPAGWRPWSTQTTTAGKGEGLQALANQLAALQRERQTQSGMVSTCRYLPDPGAVCQQERCVLKKTPDPAS